MKEPKITMPADTTAEAARDPAEALRRPESDQPVLEINNLTLDCHAHAGRAGDSPRRLVDGLSLRIERGQTLALVGESGAGKSLTSLAIMRLLPAGVHQSAGIIRFNGQNLALLGSEEMRTLRGHGLAMIMQNPMSAFDPVFTIRSHFAETTRGYGLADLEGLAVQALTEVGIDDPVRILSAYPFQLSGGMLQRVMIALALLHTPRLLIADEATTDLDVILQKQIVELLLKRKARLGLSMLLITHDLSVAAALADQVAVMHMGRLVECGSAAQLFAAPQAEYTQRLLTAHDSLYIEKAVFPRVEAKLPPGIQLVRPACPSSLISGDTAR